MKKQNRSTRTHLAHLAAFLFVVGWMLSACTESPPIIKPQVPIQQNPYVQLGEYQSNDAYQGETAEPYLMYIQTVGDKQDHFAISNFANLGKEVTAYGSEKGIFIPKQSLSYYGEVEYVIDHGSGIRTEAGLEISFSVHEGDLYLTKNIRAVYDGK